MKHYIRSKQRKIKNLIHDRKVVDEIWDDMTTRWSRREKSDVIRNTLLVTSRINT